MQEGTSLDHYVVRLITFNDWLSDSTYGRGEEKK